MAPLDGGGQELQPLHVAAGIEAPAVVTKRSDHRVAALPRPKRVDAQAGQARHGADGIAGGRC